MDLALQNKIPLFKELENVPNGATFKKSKPKWQKNSNKSHPKDPALCLHNVTGYCSYLVLKSDLILQGKPSITTSGVNTLS